MLVAPIIHTRTYYNDFLSGFLVRPDYFTSNDVEWAKRFIRASTADIDLMRGERYVVLDNGHIRIAGIVTITAELAKKNNHNIDKHFFYDNKGRNIFAFIGICTRNPLETHISITNDIFTDIFEKYVISVFNNKINDTQLVSDEITLDKGKSILKPCDKGIELNHCKIYESNSENDRKWFDYYLCCSKEKFSFCSNVSKYQTIKDSIFDSITTSPNNIKRLEYEMPSICVAIKEREENNYKQFKEKYYDRLINELEIEILQRLSKDALFKHIQNKPQIKDAVEDKIIDQLFNGQIKKTENYEIREYCFENLKKDLKFDFKSQKPLIIVKKGIK